MRGGTALHLTQDPTMKLAINNAVDKFNLPDFWGTFADFLRHCGSNAHLISGCQMADKNAELPFNHIQIWTKLQLQNRTYYAPHHVLPPQTVNAALISGAWTSSHSDVILVNTNPTQVWLASGLKGMFHIAHTAKLS